MLDQEPFANIGYVCPLHEPRPHVQYARLPPASFVGRWVQRAFAVRASSRIEHMWVRVHGVSPEGHLQGCLDNDPVYDTGYVCGDAVTVALAEIEEVCD